MKVVLSTPGRFHTFDLARQLHRRGVLKAVFSGYPRFKLRAEGLPADRIRTWPWLQTPYMAVSGRLPVGIKREWEWQGQRAHDAHVARNLPDCDVLVAMSGCGLRSGREIQARGGRHVCDRGSAHIRAQDEWMRAEAQRWGLPFKGIDPRVIDQEEQEYDQADVITVPSTFSMRTFLTRGVPASRVHLLPYGVDVSRFQPQGEPQPGDFDVLYAGSMTLNKGVPYLLKAYRQLQHARKRLWMAGTPDPAFIDRMKTIGLWPDDVHLLGHLPQDALARRMSQSHVLVLPSMQDGFGLVLSQAMACGCVPVASTHTGALDAFEDGDSGLVFEAGDADALASCLQRLADHPDLQRHMRERALQTVHRLGGWQRYGDQAFSLYQQLVHEAHASALPWGQRA
jgi:glycosyltransferase involved in cell wall biosynthesis